MYIISYSNVFVKCKTVLF